MRVCMLTTVDNPYDPYNDFDKWYLFDMLHGYDCCGYLARIAYTSRGLSDRENDEQIENAIDTIVREDFRNVYRKYVADVKEEPILSKESIEYLENLPEIA